MKFGVFGVFLCDITVFELVARVAAVSFQFQAEIEKAGERLGDHWLKIRRSTQEANKQHCYIAGVSPATARPFIG